MIVGVVFIAFAIVTFFFICFQFDEDWPLILVGFLLGVFLIFGAIITIEESIPEKKEFKYPTTEYTLEYEVISRGEQVDSTYVISKIE